MCSAQAKDHGNARESGKRDRHFGKRVENCLVHSITDMCRQLTCDLAEPHRALPNPTTFSCKVIGAEATTGEPERRWWCCRPSITVSPFDGASHDGYSRWHSGSGWGPSTERWSGSGDSTSDGHDGEAIDYRRSSRSRQAPTRATNARNENIVRTLFQKFHGPSYPALARASSTGDASAATLASCSFSGTFTKTVSRNPPPT